MEQPRQGVLEDGLDVVGVGVALGLPLLGHDVGDINFQRVGVHDGLGDALHQQVGDDGGVEAPGAQEDHIRLPDGLQGAFQGRGALRQETDPPDAAVLPLLAVEDLRLSQHPCAVFQLRLQLDVGGGHRQDPARDGQNLAHAADGLLEAAAGDAVESGEEEVAEALPL